jgi:2-octaprenyl-6-methoxyphenol hydroxylase
MPQSITDPSSFDVLIAGGGWVGISLALLLPSHLRIAVVEATPAGGHLIADDRTLVLTHSSQRILEALQLWPLVKNAATPIQHVHVSSSGHFGVCRLVAAELGLEAFGYTLPAAALTHVLQAAFQERPNLIRYSPATVLNVTFTKEKPQITLKEGEKEQIVRASLLAVADGAQSHIRKLLRIPVKTHDYNQVAIVANVQLAHVYPNCSWERFMPTGPLAMLPRGKNTAALVWCVPTQQAASMLQWSDEIFLRALQEAVGYRLGRLLGITSRTAFPVHLVAAQQRVKPGVVLIGSAACHLHPMAAQSLNLAFRDVAALAELLTQTIQQGNSPGDWQILKAYENRRRAEHNRVTYVTHGAVRLFSHPFSVIQTLGALSLLAVDTIPAAKRYLVHQAVGLR